MRFSLDLINFSGADSLHMIYSAELFAVLIRIKAVLITLSVVAGIPHRPAKRPQAVSLIRGQAECVNARICSKFFLNDLKKLRIFAKNFVANIFAIIKC